MTDSQTCCAHCRVEAKHTDNPNGTRSEYWECAYGCGAKFVQEFWYNILKQELAELKTKDFCQLAGPGRGDCEHFIGLPGISIPGQHDGPDDTKDCYDKPNGWCWNCWRSYQLDKLKKELSASKIENAKRAGHGLDQALRIGDLEKELETVLGSPSLKISAEIARARQAEIEKLEIKLKESEANYEALTTLLRNRFPRRADGSLPDFAVEDVLRENEKLKIEMAKLRAQKMSEVTPALFMDYANVQNENEKLKAELKQEKMWKVEDPRMLREKERVADVAYNCLHEEFSKLKTKYDQLVKELI